MLQDTSLLKVISQKPLRLENEGRAITVVNTLEGLYVYNSLKIELFMNHEI